jgi:exodeoxyribonuclease VIII
MIKNDLSSAEYHAHPAVSRSFLQELLRSPAHAQFKRKSENKPSKSMRRGTALHCLVLEPDFFEERFYVGEYELNTIKGKEAAAIAEQLGKQYIRAADLADCRTMARSLRVHPAAAQLLTQGQAELSFFWKEFDSGIECKCRPDWFVPGICCDVKTARDASPEGFAKDSWQHGYAMQSAFYVDGLAAVGQPCNHFLFLVVENTAPFACAVYAASEMFMTKGREQYKKALRIYAECSTTNVWPSYSEEIQYLNPPKWVI